MDCQIQNTHVCQEYLIWKKGMIEIDVDKLDLTSKELVRAKIQIKLTKNKKIQYIENGAILRIDQFIYSNSNTDLLNNFDQIKNLKFEGQYGQNNRKSGKWKTIWCGEVLKELGGYYENGLKQGLWNELIKNYQSLAKVYENGKYFNGEKYGRWKYIYKNQQIGGGLYNEKSQKNGKWIELSNGFWEMSQVTYKGQYQNGKKVGIWDIFFLKELIGAGSYNANGKKNGKWIELSERFSRDSQITYNGQYQNGKKIDFWGIWKRGEYMKEFQQFCGGSYDEGGEGKKIGKWVELSELFNEDSQISYSGQYKSGNKSGRWDILFKKYVIGGGSYDEEGQGIKLGKWIEVCDRFNNWTQVTYSGQYKNGNKTGRWDIEYEEEVIGGGSYDEGGESSKIGKWIELSDGFWRDSMVIYNGEYKNGNKAGRWDIEYEEEVIGGGSYDESGESIKIGKWIELSDGYTGESEVIYKGEYKYGIKVGRWEIEFKEKLIGGGSYDEEGEGIKIGDWIEVHDEFIFGSEITYAGQYKNGIKVGTWVEKNKRHEQSLKEKRYED